VLLRQVVTAAVLATTGDLIAQKVARRRAQLELPAVLRGKLTRTKWDIKRTMMFAVFGDSHILHPIPYTKKTEPYTLICQPLHPKP